MRRAQWEVFKKAAKSRTIDPVPLALIIDSPWMPGYLGINHFDYYFDSDVWFLANLHVMQEFPEIIMFPSWWVEYGMGIEPSALGSKLCFRPDQPPSVHPCLLHLEDVDRWRRVNPSSDALMSVALYRYQKQKQRIHDAGYVIPVVTARGPLCSAAFVRGTTELMLDIEDSSKEVHKLVAFVTDAIIDWLKAQAEAIGEDVEGIFILDDIVGFLSRAQYLEFAHPYLKRVCEAFPTHWVKVYHNDANIAPFLEDLAEVGFDVLNWSYNLDVGKVLQRIGGKVCLMGNVNPLEIGTQGSPSEVKSAALNVLRKAQGRGIILSMGGGVSPGMPKANLMAMLEAASEFNDR